MVFKKPYGFLIKHFKVIHLILTALFIYLAIRVNDILRYYSHFISGTASKLAAISYVTNYYIIAIVLSIVICLIIYALMRYKKKPRFLYLILIVLYLVVAGVIQMSYHGLETIYIASLETKTLRLYRDILRILIWFQYLSIVFVLIRGLGFDIKKFNFVQDLEELNIEMSDEEEVELTFGNTTHIQRNVHRGFREFKYYYLENKIFILIILAVVLVIGISGIVVKNEVIDKVYEEREIFSTDSFQFKVLDSYITNRGYDNQMIATENTSFVIVRLNISSRQEKKKLNTSNFILEVNHNSYSSNSRYVSKFIDLGYAYHGSQVGNNETYLFIYSVSNDDIDDKMRFVYAGDQRVVLSPVWLDKLSDKADYKAGQSIDLSSSSLGSGYFKISSFEIQDKFSYSYEYEVMGEVYTSELSISSAQGVIMHLLIDSSLPYQLNHYSFLLRYAKLKYKIGEEEYTSYVFGDKTPGNYKGGLYLVVDKNIVNATNIWLDIKIRNNQYIYTLK